MKDWMNTILEFASFLLLFLMFSNYSIKLKNFFLYSLLCIIASFIISSYATPLIINICFFIFVSLLSCHINFLDNIVFSAISMMVIIYVEFMFCSILPISLLQTDFGNTIVVLSIFLILCLFFFLSSKYTLRQMLPSLIKSHKILVLCVLFFTCLLGQSYLSRLSVFWTYLPGVVSVFLFILALISLLFYVHYAKSADKLHIHMLTTHINDIEASIHSLRIQNHDYKHHIRNLKNQINTATTLDELRPEVNTYIDQMEEDRLWLNSILNIDQPVLRSVVYGCYSKCLQENIAFNFSSSDQLPNFPLKDYQLVELFENLIVNAIEQNMLLPTSDRSISICFFAEGQHNEITISNPITDSVLSLSDMFTVGTTTKDTTIHQGLGLSSIQTMCSTNNIAFYGQREDASVSFSIIYEEV